jgi:hypothetical protein
MKNGFVHHALDSQYKHDLNEIKVNWLNLSVNSSFL